MKRNLDVISTEQLKRDKIHILADPSLDKLVTSEGALSKPFNVFNFTYPGGYNLLVRGYAFYYGGFAEHTREIVLRLRDKGSYNILLSAINSGIHLDPGALADINSLMKNPYFRIEDSVFLGIAGPGHFQDKKEFIPQDGRYKIGWTMIETREAQPRILDWINNLDEVWCPTDTDMRRFRSHNNIVKMRLGYDEKRYNQLTKEVDIPSVRGKFVFGVLGSWNRRKGVRAMVRAFCKAFAPTEPVSLLLTCKYGTRPYNETAGYCGAKPRTMEDKDNWTIEWELQQILNELGKDKRELPHIAVLDVPLHPNVIPHVMARFNCLVGFSRGESTWLPGLQAMAMGKPIIQLASECSGFMEYLDDTGFMCRDVRYEMATQSDAEGTSGYYAEEELATGNEDELRDKMQMIYQDHVEMGDECLQRITKGVEKVKDWTWDKAVEATDIRLRKIFCKRQTER